LVRKDDAQKKQISGEKMRTKSCGKTKTDGESWLLDSHTLEMSQEGERKRWIEEEVLLSFSCNFTVRCAFPSAFKPSA
jgi:hypothetical protein